MTGNSETSYEKRWVALIDILGFKEFVNAAVQEGCEVETIEELKSILEDARAQTTRWNQQHSEKAPLSLRMISDTLCLSSPVRLWSHYVLVQSAAFLLCNLALTKPPLADGLFARGAIIRMNHYDDGELIFSPALIQAYDTEQNLALYPRVLTRCAGPFEVVDHPGGEARFASNLLWRDRDGLLFVNYLDVLLRSDEQERRRCIGQHRANIVSRLVQFAEKPRIFAKYGWLTSYHNRFCRFIADDDPWALDLNIDIRQIRGLPVGAPFKEVHEPFAIAESADGSWAGREGRKSFTPTFVGCGEVMRRRIVGSEA